MLTETRMRALRPALVVAAFGATLAGCNLPPSSGHHGGGGYHRSSSYYSAPSHYRRSEHHRPRTENWSQQRLQQHWLNQAQRAR